MSGPARLNGRTHEDLRTEGITPSGLAYTVQGYGPPLLWLSGYVVSASSIDGAVREFAQRFTCITFDHRGSGLSRAPWAPMTTVGMARDALSLMRHLDVGSAHVHGSSLGGMVAQELAIRAPDRVRTLVLSGTTAGGVAAVSPPPRALLRGVWQAGKALPGQSCVGMRGAVCQGWAAATHDTTSRLHRVQAPTLVVHGDRDELVPLANARRLAELIPGAELRVVGGAGHLLQVESRAANEAIALWLDARRTVGARGRRATALSVQDVALEPWRRGIRQSLPLRRALRILS